MESEAEHNLLLGIIARLIRGDHDWSEPIYLASATVGEAVVGCAWRTPPFKLGLTRMTVEVVPVLVDDLAEVYDSIETVMGPVAAAEEFGRLWSERRGLSARTVMRQGIYELTSVTPRSGWPAGHFRKATAEDVKLLAEWSAAFQKETHVDIGDPDRRAGSLVESGRMFVWDDGAVRTMAAAVADTPNGVRVGYVYTPPEHRGRGYASACVAALSQWMLDEGRKYCFLYTDLDNPTTNAIYRRIGYELLSEVVDVHFESPEVTANTESNKR